jgi:hypothetical protein
MRIYVIAFISGFALDILYCRWVLDVTKSRPLHAGLASMAIGGFGLLGLATAVENHWAAIPYILGLGLGTVTAVLHDGKPTP